MSESDSDGDRFEEADLAELIEDAADDSQLSDSDSDSTSNEETNDEEALAGLLSDAVNKNGLSESNSASESTDEVDGSDVLDETDDKQEDEADLLLEELDDALAESENDEDGEVTTFIFLYFFPIHTSLHSLKAVQSLTEHIVID